MCDTRRLSLDGNYVIVRRQQRFAAKFLGRSDVSGNSEINNDALCRVSSSERTCLSAKRERTLRKFQDGKKRDNELSFRWIFFFDSLGLYRSHSRSHYRADRDKSWFIAGSLRFKKRSKKNAWSIFRARKLENRSNRKQFEESTAGNRSTIPAGAVSHLRDPIPFNPDCFRQSIL